MSNVRNSWMWAVCGRMESDYQYSASYFYNSFPLPSPTEQQTERINKTAQVILDARAKYPHSTLADMYRQHMYLYPELLTAHQENNRAVIMAYGITSNDEAFKSESVCVAMLMKMY